jgi:hypothetical protein
LKKQLALLPVLIAASVASHAATIEGSRFATANNGSYGSNGPGFLYAISESSSGYADYPLMTFDFSSVSSSDILGDGTLTLTLHDMWPDSTLSATLEVDPLTAAYDPATVSLLPSYATALDSHTFLLDSTTGDQTGSGQTISFAIPQATLIAWATSPATNYGVVLRYPTFANTQGHSDITFQTSTNAPFISFASPTPEPSSFLMLSGAVLGLLAVRRKR